MKNISITIILPLLVVGLAVFYLIFSENTSSNKTATIIVSDTGFTPSYLAVSKGTQVIFVNNGKNLHWPASDFHPTHGIYPEFDPERGLNPGGEWGIVLKTGKWHYHDHLYPNFTGLIEVK